jgi:hypothetical protein
MALTSVPAQKHVRSLAPYNANTFAEQNKALLGKSARLQGFGFVAITPGATITLAPGFFVSVGLALAPGEPDRIAGIVAEVIANSVIDISGLNASGDFYVFALTQTPSEGTTIDIITADGPAPPSSQHAPIGSYIAGQWLPAPALSGEGVEGQVLTARVDSGANEFLLTFEAHSSPLEINLGAANLPDGTLFPATLNYAGAPAFSAPGTNYVWFNTALGVIQNGAAGFPPTGAIPLWEFVLDGSSEVTSLIDRRPHIGGGGAGSGDAGEVKERLKEILQHSVMQNARCSDIEEEAAPHVDTVSSSGTFLGPSEYSLADTQELHSDFAGAALEAPASIDQVTVAVLVDQLLAAGDIQIEVSRDGGANYEVVADNFTNHVFGAVPVGNNLQIKITNVAGGPDPIVIKGYGMYYNNIGGPTGVLGTGPGILLDGSGLNVTGMIPNPTWRFADAPMSFTFTTAGGGVLSWSGDFRLAFWNGNGGLFTNRIVGPAAVGPPLVDGDFVYADIVPGVDDAVIVLQVQIGGAPPQAPNRIIFGCVHSSRFHMQSGMVLEDQNLIPGALSSYQKPVALPLPNWQALLAAVGPTAANRFITAAELPAAAAGFKGIGVGAVPWGGPGVASNAVNFGAAGAQAVLITARNAARINEIMGIYWAAFNAWYHPVYAPVGVVVSAGVGTTLLWDNFAPRVFIQQAGGILNFSGDNGAGGVLGVMF